MPELDSICFYDWRAHEEMLSERLVNNLGLALRHEFLSWKDGGERLSFDQIATS
jgi:hypothetical protein